MIEKNSILIVDDEAMNITALSQMLKNDYTIYVEKDGQGCIETALALQPDLILLDILMPAMDGFDVIDTLKTREETKHIPVIFVTGLSNAKDEEKMYVLGASDYISKPFSSVTVKLRVRLQMQIINQNRKIHNLIITDPLTEIGNRCFFYEKLEQEWSRSLRQQTPISVLMIDLDNFKTFNDAYGHLHADMVLRGVAGIIKNNLSRAIDVPARWGGEEFAIILPDTPLPGACIVAEKIRADIEKHDFIVDDTTQASTHITVSIGVHCVTPERESDYSIKNLYADVNKALNYAKIKGRNRVGTYTES